MHDNSNSDLTDLTWLINLPPLMKSIEEENLPLNRNAAEDAKTHKRTLYDLCNAMEILENRSRVSLQMQEEMKIPANKNKNKAAKETNAQKRKVKTQQDNTQKNSKRSKI